jgi:tetratricopeptide (TPR) repeat protein
MKFKRQHKGWSNLFTVAALAVFAVFASFAAAPARAAGDAEQAEALIREGVKLRAQDAAARALPLFEKAYEISRGPRTAAQLGLCELELGYFVEAERHLNEALAAPEHPWVAKNKGTLKKPLETARANVGELTLTVSPATADVLLNHKPIDNAQLAAPIRLARGIVDVEVRAPGYQTVTETVIVAGGKREQRAYTLAREIAPPPLAAAPAAPAPSPALTLDSAPANQGAADPHKSKRIAAYITGGAAFGALVFGTVEAISAHSRSNAFNDHTAVGGNGTFHDCGTNMLSPTCKALKDNYDQALTLTIVGFAAAGALAATSSVLFVLSSPGHGEATGARAFACAPDLGARGVGCSLRF